MIGNRLRTLSLTIAGALTVSPLLADGEAYRVRDLRTVPTGTGYFSGELGQLPDAALLLGGLPTTGAEPWVTDGTSAGTHLLRNLAPGGLSSAYTVLGRAGGYVFFSAWTPAAGIELWRSDGTAAGTLQLGDLLPGRESSYPGALGILGDVLLFSARDGSEGTRVWRTDGSVAGTWRVSDLPRVCDGAWGELVNHSTLDGRVYFSGDDALHGCEPFASDGTSAGTRQVADVFPGAIGSGPTSFWAAFGRIYFAARDFTHGRELWVTDGTAGGTRLVADLVPDSGDSWPEPLGAVGGGLAFVVDGTGYYSRVLWTDGKTGATPLVDSSVYLAHSGLAYGGRLVFFASDAVHGHEPWTTDGTPEGTVLLADLHPGADSSIWGGSLAAGSRGVYFIAWDANWDGALWLTDGKPGGSTVRIGDTASAESIVGFAEVGGRQVFEFYWWEYCGPHSECDYWDSWVSDGTEAGTHPLWLGPIEWSASRPRELTARPGGLVFTADSDLSPPDGWGGLAYRTDGSEAGTAALATAGGELLAAYEAAGPLPDGSVLLAGRTETWDETLWRADGDLVSLVREPGGTSGGPEDPEEVTQVGNLVYFSGRDGSAGGEPWRSDGTAEGTFRIYDIFVGGFSWPADFTPVAGGVWFGAENAEQGREAWETDGTTAGTLVHDLTPGPDSTLASQFSTEIVPLGPDTDALVFRANDDLLAHAPGAAVATHLKTFSENLRSLWSDPVLTPFAGRVYFIDADAAANCELWATDGTVEGTQRVAPIGFGWADSPWFDPCPPRATAFAGRLFFTACTGAAGCELWTSDGTEQGTQLFADLEPGPASLLPTNLTPIGDRMYFSACTEAGGCEPWVTDGTIAGTQPLDDIAPGAWSSDPKEFTLSSCLVYFAADDGTGAELWAMATGLFCDGFESGDTSRWQGF